LDRNIRNRWTSYECSTSGILAEGTYSKPGAEIYTILTEHKLIGHFR
jgi:hypothetical protein